MKINEVIVKEWTGPGKEFAPPTPKDFLPKKKQKLVMAQAGEKGRFSPHLFTVSVILLVAVLVVGATSCGAQRYL